MSKDGFIILTISDSGIERTKIYHKAKATAQVLALYEKITPDLERLHRKIRKQKPDGTWMQE